MLDVKKTREEIASIHKLAEDHIEKFSAVGSAPTEDEAKQQADRFSRIEQLGNSIEAAEKLAKYAYSKDPADQPKDENDKPVPVKHRAVKSVAGPEFKPTSDTLSKEQYAKELSSWVAFEEPENYATISVTGNAAIVPQVVGAFSTPTKYNCYRAAILKLGLKVETFGNTATASAPVLTSNSGGLIPEGTQSESNDADPAIASLKVPAHGYQSKTYWYSNELINAEQFDVTSSSLPALQGAREYGFSKAISAAIIADTGITQWVNTPTDSTISLDTMDSLIHSFSLLWDNNKALFVGMDVYNALESLQDSNGRPIFEYFGDEIQNMHFLSYKGVPVFKHDTFQSMGVNGNVVGCAISLDGFKMRDEIEKLLKYIDNPDFVDMTGLNSVRYQGYAWVNNEGEDNGMGSGNGAVTLLIAGTGS